MSIIEKPWGKEELLEHNEKYVLKKLTMHAGHRCSLQYHEMKVETVYVLSGKLNITLGSSPDDLEDKVYMPGDYLTLKTHEIHRMEAVEDCVYLEASTPELDDVIRISDDYKRS